MRNIKKFAALCVACFMLVGILTPALAAGSEGYTDVPQSYWAYEEIQKATEMGLFNGVSDTEFDPEGTMTRAMAVTIICRLAGVQVNNSSSSSFEDVPSDEWYTGAVVWATGAGITNGTSATTFSPYQLVTREEMATFLMRYADYACISLPENGTAAFTDESSISDWALDAVLRCQSAGILEGRDGGNFDPQASMTRAEAAAVMVRMSEAEGEISLDLSQYASDWSYIAPYSFELVAAVSSGWGAATMVPTGVYNDTGVYALEGIPYVTNPTMYNGKPVQLMNIYVPEEYMKQNADGTVSIDPAGSKTVTCYDDTGAETGTYTWTAETAPIIFINTVNGYAGSERFSIEDCNSNIFYMDYVSKGYIIVGVDSRGIGNSWGGTTTVNDDGIVVGKAPSGIVDLKAAVSFLKYNDDVLAGDGEKIVSLGYSAGGAMSALLGASGDAAEYDPYLKEIGAADASNSVYASQVYCPITDLDAGDGAFEWLHMYQTAMTDWSGNPASFSDYEIALHDALIDCFVEYINSLGFDLGEDGKSGAYYDGFTEALVEALNHAVLVGQYMGEAITPEEVIASIAAEDSTLMTYLEENNMSVEDVLYWDEENQTFVLAGFEYFDMGGTFEREKGVPGFDGNVEAGLFGANGGTEDVTAHFSYIYLDALSMLMESDDPDIAAQASADYAEVADEIEATIDSGITNLMNPMYFLTGESSATIAQYWRFGNGTTDPDLGSVAAWTLYNQICSMGDEYSAEFQWVYGAPHGFADYMNGSGYYYTPEALLSWIAEICA